MDANGNKYLTLVYREKKKRSITKIHRTFGWD